MRCAPGLAAMVMAVLSACATRPPPAPRAPVAASALPAAPPLPARFALGALDDSGGEPEAQQARWRQIADLEEAAGATPAAREALSLWLNGLGIAAAMAEAEGAPDLAARRERLNEAVARVAAFAERTRTFW